MTNGSSRAPAFTRVTLPQPDQTTSDLALDRIAESDRSGGRRSAIDRSDHRRDVHAGLRVPEHRVPAAEQARHQEQRRGLRRAGRVLRLRLWRRDGRQLHSQRPEPHRARRRRGDVLAHSRFQRSHHVRAVRRRRGRSRAAGIRRTGRAVERAARGRQLFRHSLHAGQRERRRGGRQRVPAHGRAGRLQARGQRARKGRARSARQGEARSRKTSTG